MMGKRFLFVLLLIALTQVSFGQTALKGIIKDGKGQPVEAASVKVKGTVINAVADGKGQFSIPAPKELPFALLISSAGYYPSEIQVTELKDSVLNIVLIDNNQLSEV